MIRDERYYPALDRTRPYGHEWGVWDSEQCDWILFPTMSLKEAGKESARLERDRFPTHTFVRYSEHELFYTWLQRDGRHTTARKLKQGRITYAGVAVKLTAAEQAVINRYEHMGERSVIDDSSKVRSF